MSISVRDILKLESLRTLQLVGGETGLEKCIEWIYVAECFENPLEGIKWLQGGEIIFITGVGIKDNTEMLLEFIKGIDEKNGAGLVVNVGPYIRSVSSEAIELANKLGMPLFELPWEVKLVEVSREISNAIVLSRIEENSLTHFLSNILFGDGELEGDAIQKAAYFGYNLSGECCICVIDIDAFEKYLKLKDLDDEVSISKLKVTFRKLVQDVLEKHALKVPIIDKDDSVIFFAKSEENFMKRVEKALIEIQQLIHKRIDGISVSVGIGNPYKDLKMMKQSLSEAEIAINSLKCQGLTNAIIKYKDAGVYSLLFNIKNKYVLENYFRDTLGAISSKDNKDSDLIEILDTYLNENCNITVTAEKLFLHRNTLKYKIRKIEELLNCDLHNFNDCMKVRIALNIGKMF